MRLYKIRLSISILSLLCWIVGNVLAQTTNCIPPNIFLTDDGFLFWYQSSGERVVHVEKINEAEKSKESRPANQDPDGHWGQPTNGFQLSLRFEKATFTNGEPIVATMLMRNVTDKPQIYFRPTHIVTIKDGKLLKGKGDAGPKQITMSPETTLFPQTQHKYQVKLNQDFDLSKNGEYIFQARCKQPKVTSQTVSVLITNAVEIK